MSKELKLLNASIDNERHVYTWKCLGTSKMILMWLCIGMLWFSLLRFWKYFEWSIFNIFFCGLIILEMPFILYLTVLKTSIEINSDKLFNTKTPFGLLSKNIELKEINSINHEIQIIGGKYNIKAELKNGKKVKLLEGLKQDDAIEITKFLDSSVKHFQHPRLTAKLGVEKKYENSE